MDKTAPTVSSLVATDKSRTGVPLRKTKFRANFSEAMDTLTLNTSTFKLYKCASSTDTTCTTQITNVTVTPSSDGLSVTLYPSTLLEAKTKYKMVVSTGAEDLAGNALAQQKDAYFTTGST